MISYFVLLWIKNFVDFSKKRWPLHNGFFLRCNTILCCTCAREFHTTCYKEWSNTKYSTNKLATNYSTISAKSDKKCTFSFLSILLIALSVRPWRDSSGRVFYGGNGAGFFSFFSFSGVVSTETRRFFFLLLPRSFVFFFFFFSDVVSTERRRFFFFLLTF